MVGLLACQFIPLTAGDSPSLHRRALALLSRRWSIEENRLQYGSDAGTTNGVGHDLTVIPTKEGSHTPIKVRMRSLSRRGSFGMTGGGFFLRLRPATKPKPRRNPKRQTREPCRPRR